MISETNLKSEMFDLFNKGKYEEVLEKSMDIAELDSDIWKISAYIALYNIKMLK